MIYLNLSSSDSLDFHPENNSFDFIVELPTIIEGQFSCALIDFFCEAATFEPLYIFCDICEPEYVLDSVRPLLRIVAESGEVNTAHSKKVNRREIRRVQLSIRDRTFSIPSSPIGRVRMTIVLDDNL